MKAMNAVLAIAMVVLPVTAFAQHTTYKQRHSIQARQNNRQARIAKGMQDGQITPKGAAAAESRQAKIASEENSMRQADNGHLTAADRHTLANAATDPDVAPNLGR